MTIEEIAKARDLVTGTIATHLEHYLREDKIKLEQVVTADKIRRSGLIWRPMNLWEWWLLKLHWEMTFLTLIFVLCWRRRGIKKLILIKK